MRKIDNTTVGNLFRGVIRDFPRKLIALFFAVLIYFYVDGKLNSVTVDLHNVPIRVELPPELVLSDNVEPKASLRLRGDSRSLTGIQATDFAGRVRVSGSSYLPGAPIFLELKTNLFAAPRGVAVVEILEPKVLKLKLESSRTVKLPIRSRFNSLSNLSRDYAVDQVTFEPAEVQVTGAASVIKLLSAIYTEPIPLDRGVTESFEYATGLDFPSGIAGTPRKVTARIGVVRSMVSRTFRDLPVRLLTTAGTPANLKSEILPSPKVSVTVSGPLARINAIKIGDLKPYLELPSVSGAGTYEVVAGCYLDQASGGEIRSISPEKLTVRLTEVKPR